MAISIRTRFETFKRDNFTCRYCGRKSPEVVLEVDHIVPCCEGGSDDTINLAVSCWDCNRGKAGVPLSELITGEDPHDRAILLLEKERQLREYNKVLARSSARREKNAQVLLNWWCAQTGVTSIPKNQFTWLKNELNRTPKESVRSAMEIAIGRGMIRDWRYVIVVLRNWREDGNGGASLA